MRDELMSIRDLRRDGAGFLRDMVVAVLARRPRRAVPGSVRVAVFVAAVAAATAGCSRFGAESADGLLTRTLPSDGEMTAIVGGTLGLDSDRGCVLLSGKPVVWPAGTTLTTDPLGIHLPSGLVGRPGDSVRGAGGEVPAAGIRATALRIEGDLTEALACAPPTSEVVVFWARGGGLRVSPAD